MPKKKTTFHCTLCCKTKDEVDPYFTRIEHIEGVPVVFGVCRPCLALTRKKNEHFFPRRKSERRK